MVNGSSSGSPGGATISVQNTGSTIVAIGNYSNLIGGAYDSTATVYSSTALRFYIGSAVQATLSTSGNLGLGVTPSAWGSSYKAIQIPTGQFASTPAGAAVSYNQYYDGTNYKYIANGAASLYAQADTHKWFIAASGTAGGNVSFTQAMTLDASGDLTLPANFRLGNGNQIVSAANTNDLQLNASNGSGNILFRVAGSERARIDSSGNLLVGTTSVFASSKFTVSNTDKGIGIQITGTTKQSVFGLYIGKPDNDTTTSQRFVGFSVNNDAAGSGQINANGASQAAFGSFSDARLKDNIVDLEPQLEKVLQLRPVEFDYKDGSGHQTGFVAQEMQEVYPDAIGEQDGFLTVTGYGKTEARLIKAIQEQQAIIESLKARLDAANL